VIYRDSSNDIGGIMVGNKNPRVNQGNMLAEFTIMQSIGVTGGLNYA